MVFKLLALLVAFIRVVACTEKSVLLLVGLPIHEKALCGLCGGGDVSLGGAGFASGRFW